MHNVNYTIEHPTSFLPLARRAANGLASQISLLASYATNNNSKTLILTRKILASVIPNVTLQLQQKRHHHNRPGLSLRFDVCSHRNPPVSVSGQAGAVTRRHRPPLLGFFCYVRPGHTLSRLVSSRTATTKREGVNKKLSRSTVSPPMLIPQRRKALASASAASPPPPPPPPPPPAADSPLTFDASVQNQPQYRLLRSFRSRVLVYLSSVAEALCIYEDLAANALNNLWGFGL